MVDIVHAANGAHSSWGNVFYVLNQANARARIFAKEADYAAFERVMMETLAEQSFPPLHPLAQSSDRTAAGESLTGALFACRSFHLSWVMLQT